MGKRGSLLRGQAVEEGHYLFCPGKQKGLLGGAQLPGVPHWREREMPAAVGTELDQRAPTGMPPGVASMVGPLRTSLGWAVAGSGQGRD